MSQKRSARARWSVFGRRTASSGLGGEPGKETRHICRLTEVGERAMFCGRVDASAPAGYNVRKAACGAWLPQVANKRAQQRIRESLS